MCAPGKAKELAISRKLLIISVSLGRFELPTSCLSSKRSKPAELKTLFLCWWAVLDSNQ